MPINIGSSNIKKIYVGNNEVKYIIKVEGEAYTEY